LLGLLSLSPACITIEKGNNPPKARPAVILSRRNPPGAFLDKCLKGLKMLLADMQACGEGEREK
jgi:hypothetical protein